MDRKIYSSQELLKLLEIEEVSKRINEQCDEENCNCRSCNYNNQIKKTNTENVVEK